MPIAAGPHELEVVLTRTGPGPRLRLGWTWPRAGRPPGDYDEVVLPRDLGPEVARAWWWATDALALVAAVLVALVVWRLPWDAPRVIPVGHPVTRAEIGWSLAGHAALVALMSWPLVTDLAGLGVMDRADGRLNAWILAWDAHALARAPGRLFQAPIFHPLPDALAFSENLLVPAVLGAPAQALGGPVLAYNVVLLVSLVVSGLGVQLLVRRASGDRLAAFVAGVFFAAGAHRWIRLAHLHAQVTLFLPFVLIAFDRFWERRTLGRAAPRRAAARPPGAFVRVPGRDRVARRRRRGRPVAFWPACDGRELARLAVGLAVAGLLLAPIAWPYLRMRAFQGAEFTIADVATYATTLRVVRGRRGRVSTAASRRSTSTPRWCRTRCSPGSRCCLCGIVGLAAAPRRYRALAVAASAVGDRLLPRPGDGGLPLPPRARRPRARRPRALALLAGARARAVRARRVRAGRAMAGGAPRPGRVPRGVDQRAHPVRARRPRRRRTARWLAGGEGAVAVLPLGERDTEVMLEQTAHWRPLVNGDSGFMPRPYTREMELLVSPAGEEALRLLRAVDVRHVVARETLPLPVAFASGDERVYAVPPGPSARVPEAGPAASRRGGRRVVSSSISGLRVRWSPSSSRFRTSRGWMRPPSPCRATARAGRPVAARASLADATLALLRDPRHGRGEVTFGPVTARFVRLPLAVPARPGVLSVR